MNMRNERLIGRLRQGFGAQDERGIALITTMLIMMLMTALMIGFTTVVTSDQRYRLIDRDRVKAFYGALSGLEKLNTDLAELFLANVAPNDTQIAALSDDPPDIEDITFTSTGNGAYGVTYVEPAEGESEYGHIASGPYEGLLALKKKYDLDATVRTTGGGEAHLRRSVETVAIPVFQFGMFSEPDLSFHAGANFNFGGRVHTNANLFLAADGTSTLTLSEKVTAVGEVYRAKLVNGRTTTHPSNNIRVATSTGSYRNLTKTPTDEGSANAADVERAGWTSLSLSTYNGYIRDGTTGAKALNLPVITSGGMNTDLVRRPPVGELDSAATNYNPTLYGERMFGQVSLRILLSDTSADITNLPDIGPGDPVPLEDWNTTLPAGYGPIDGTHPPIARSPGYNIGTLTANPGTGTQNLTFAAIPAYWAPPTLQTVVATVTFDITCTGRGTGQNTFTGCTIPMGAVTIPDGNQLTATVDNQAVTTNVVGLHTVINGGAGSTITVTANSTAKFVRDTMWVRDTANPEAFAQVLTTCLGNSTTQLLSCGSIPAALDVNDQVTTASRSDANIGLIGGFIKMELQDADGDWNDVTLEILNYGIGGPNLAGNVTCADPTPNAIVRIQRLRDHNSNGCTYAGSTKSTDYWPNVLFDPREALQRDVSPGDVNFPLGGVIHYINLDVANLSRWFTGTAAPYDAGTGNTALSVNGYSVYFSDRRNNRNASNAETGEYGFEDIVNPASATGTPNDLVDEGEDLQVVTPVVLDTYGQFPSYLGTASSAPPCALCPGATGAPLDSTARPTTSVRRGVAQTNRAILFRRALKLTGGQITGGVNPIIAPGLTIVSENPVYVQGNYNASSTSATAEPNVATSVIADAITLLSSAWNDNISFSSPYTPGGRVRNTNYYRFAVIAGKNRPFAYADVVTPKPDDFGSDGGAHNFLRMLESGATVNYRGALATVFYSRQAVGVYKCCATVYGAPTRNFNFDTDFLDPAKLPPLTPVFRDINSLGFEQETRPGQ